MKPGSHRAWRPLLVLPLLLAAACGPRPPTDSFSANLDANCKPHDPYDKLAAMIDPRAFWLRAFYGMEGLIKAGNSNLEHSRQFLTENRSGRGQFRALVLERARELGYSPARAREMLADNMRAFELQAVGYKRNIERQRRELEWARGCRQVARGRLDSLGVTSAERIAAAPGARKKIVLTYEGLLKIKNLTVDQARELARDTTISKRDVRRALDAQGVPRDIQEDILSAFDGPGGS